MEACGGYTENLKLLRYIANFVIPVFVITRFDCISNTCFVTSAALVGNDSRIFRRLVGVKAHLTRPAIGSEHTLKHMPRGFVSFFY